jgi:hypothetical protein
MGGSVEQGKVIVKKADLLIGLKLLAVAAKGKNPPQLVVYTENGSLFFRVGAVLHRMPAYGTFTGVGRVSGTIVKGIKTFLPDDEEVTITQIENRISFDKMKVSCVWEVQALPSTMQLPLNLSFLETLAMRYKYSMEQIENAGYLKVLEKAEEEKDRQIYNALDALSSFHIGYGQINSLVVDFIKRSITE